jgi:hypothetical protein
MTFNVHPQFASLIDSLGVTEMETFWTYRCVEESFLPPHHIHIYDYQLSKEQLNEYELEYVQTTRAIGLYTMTPHGAHYFGIGVNIEWATAHAVYQEIRKQFFGAGLPFTPLITYEEIAVVGEDECLPTQHITHLNYDEINELLTEMKIADPVNQGYAPGWAVEHSPSQWSWACDFPQAVMKLYEHIPASWVVH